MNFQRNIEYLLWFSATNYNVNRIIITYFKA